MKKVSNIYDASQAWLKVIKELLTGRQNSEAELERAKVCNECQYKKAFICTACGCPIIAKIKSINGCIKKKW